MDVIQLDKPCRAFEVVGSNIYVTWWLGGDSDIRVLDKDGNLKKTLGESS